MVLKFHGADYCDRHVIYRCFHCNAGARIKDDIMYMLKPHGTACRGERRYNFTQEQRMRRMRYNENTDEKRRRLLQYCSVERMLDKKVR
uniref:Nuclear receptor domain-containing protein n=1 Tax=Panagrellus redivivus TaxID=6233 RepID=A0A7E4VTR3_PANRE